MTKRKLFGGSGDPALFARAGAMRGQPTQTEELLWTYLRTKPLGLKFRRQHVYGPYILDFYCHVLQLVIEVDGPIHQQPEIAAADAVRQQQLEDGGLFFLRFSNDEVKTHLDEVQKKIERVILERLENKNKDSQT